MCSLQTPACAHPLLRQRARTSSMVPSSVSRCPPGGGVGSQQRIYRPQWTTAPHPSQQLSGGAFGNSLDLSAAGDRLAVGAPSVGLNVGGVPHRGGTAFSYTVSKNGAGEIVGLIPDQTSGFGILPINQSEDGVAIGTHVATNGSWLLASSGPASNNPKSILFSASGANGWTTDQVIPATRRAVMSDTHIVGSAGYAATFSGSNVVPITGQGDQPTVDGLSFSVNNSVAVSASNGDIGIWRMDCSGDLLSYSGVVDAYCSATNNSTGGPAVTTAMGSYLAGDNDMTLRVTGLPQNQSGYFLVSANQGFIAHAGGSAGHLCLGSPLGRYNQQVQNSGLSGSFELTIDLTALPLNPLTPVLPGGHLSLPGLGPGRQYLELLAPV